MYINGRNAVIEAIRADERVEKVYFIYGLEGDGAAAVKRTAKQAGVPCTTLDRERFRLLERKARLKTRSQGIIAWINPVFYVDVEDIVTLAYEQGHAPLLVALDDITDPRNIGAIIRSAECAGLDGLVFGKRNSPGINDVVVKTSAGAAHFLPVARADSLPSMLQLLQKSGLKVVGLDERGTESFTEIDLTEPTVVVFGNEGQGISKGVANVCDSFVSIPMQGKITSLNVSVAAGVVFFEALRQRQERQKKEERSVGRGPLSVKNSGHGEEVGSVGG